MRRKLVRVLMVVIGLISLSFYTAGAYVTYLVLRRIWANRPSAVISVLLLMILTLALGYLSYRYGTAQLLTATSAVQASPQDAPNFFRRLEQVCLEMDIDPPRVMISNVGEPNAFAMSSPKGGVVVFDRSLLALLTPDELEAVLAHELAHLERHDSLIQLLSFTGLQTVVLVLMIGLSPALFLLTGVAKAGAWARGQPTAWTRSFAWRFRTLVIVLVMIGPAIVTFLLFARSRRLEFAADERAAEVTGDPIALARALEKIDDVARQSLQLRSLLPTEEQDSDPLARLLATHPATDQRIERLRAVATK